jgi:sulfur carrier protein
MPSTAHPSDAITIVVNGVSRSIAAGASLLDLLGEMALAGRPGMAVAVNGAVVSKADWSARIFRDGDQVLLIHASQGG